MSKKEKVTTFMEFLKEQEPETLIYLGTEKGSSWIVIEPAAVLIEKMNKLEKFVMDKITKIVSDAQKNIDNGPRLMVELRGKIENPETEPKEVTALTKRLYEWEKTFAASVNTRANMNKYLNSYIDVKDRAVLETYPINKIDGIDSGIAVKITGIELGTLWWRNEHKTI